MGARRPYVMAETSVFLFEVRDSDGNDTIVYDALITALTEEEATATLWRYLATRYPDDESDGGFGTFHACDCVCPHRAQTLCPACRTSWECDHGGLLVSEMAWSYPTLDTAHRARKRYHRR